MVNSSQFQAFESFRPNGDDFRSLSRQGLPSPAYTIAKVIQERRITGAGIDMPEGLDSEDLDGLLDVVRLKTMHEGEETIPGNVGSLLRILGEQVLKLEDDLQIQPPLTPFELQSVRRLVTVVGSTEIVVAHRS